MIDRLKQDADKVLDRRYELVLLFDVKDGNPNGDPDADNLPRLDPETNEGLVSDVCVKRKIRNFVGQVKSSEPPFDIFVKERGILANEQKKAYLATNQEPGAEPNKAARAWMCENYYDIRAFGAVMTTGKAPAEDGKTEGKGRDGKVRQWNCGQVRGPVQVAFSRSVHALTPASHAITRVALTNATDTKRKAVETEDGGEEAATLQMGRKHTVPYGLYRCHIFLTPFLAKDTKFTNGDLSLLLDALKNMFELDRSAARGLMSSQALYVFEHSSELGNAPSHKLFDLVKVEAKNDAPRRFPDDFNVAAPENGSEPMPGVKLWRIL
jgi:CRISPR-associated protein Csd2